ncbi:DedA family protein [Saccharibacillus kuerlensis]|uniref:Alkaline phosphatase n=1 Tax=Saccharibacillus kuerlensis TaxID=459527 RepID=A0ABQ2L9L3_9BACL|nr:DedA family protein [Saccharibacillus kuerlensis]GGO07641.1 alkaline phosphatase [Saccharibacillus kuerlensis]
MGFISDVVSQLFQWIQGLGYFGIMIGLMVEVIPSEIVLAYGGYLVYLGDINFWGAVLFGTIGGVFAQLFIYWISRYGGRPVLNKFGKYIFIKESHIDHAEKWFNKYGTGIIFSGRFIPVVRHAISIPAGLAKMSTWRFTWLTTLAVIPWSILFISLGYQLGSQWERIDEVAAPYIIPIVLTAAGLLIVYLVVKTVLTRRKKSRA